MCLKLFCIFPLLWEVFLGEIDGYIFTVMIKLYCAYLTNTDIYDGMSIFLNAVILARHIGWRELVSCPTVKKVYKLNI